MAFSAWLPAISTTSLFGLFLFLARNVIKTRLTNAVRHEYDEKLEILKADLKRKDDELNFIKNAALTGLNHRQSLIFEKQLTAAETLWKATLCHSGGKPVSEMMSRVKAEIVKKTVATDPKIQEFFKIVGGNADLKKVAEINANEVRPFLSEPAWSYYSAYQAIIFHFILQAKLFEFGLDDNLLKTKEMIELTKVALPHQSQFIDEFGPQSIPMLLDEIENKILNEIRNIIKGKEVDQDSLERAKKIQELAEQINEPNKTLQADPES